MINIVLTFAAITALFETILLMHFSNEQWLRGHWVVPLIGVKVGHSSSIHLVAIAINLAIHWGTIVGTMTAITAGLVSFATVPAVVWFMAFRRHYKEADPRNIKSATYAPQKHAVVQKEAPYGTQDR